MYGRTSFRHAASVLWNCYAAKLVRDDPCLQTRMEGIVSVICAGSCSVCPSAACSMCSVFSASVLHFLLLMFCLFACLSFDFSFNFML